MNTKMDYPLYGSPYNPNTGRPETVAEKLEREAKDPRIVAANNAAQGQIGKPSQWGGSK